MSVRWGVFEFVVHSARVSPEFVGAERGFNNLNSPEAVSQSAGPHSETPLPPPRWHETEEMVSGEWSRL